MLVSKIKLESPGEVRGHFADIVYFQGCSRNCCYCFNPSTQSTKKGTVMANEDIWDAVKNSMSDILVLTGGEPLEQNIIALHRLILHAKFKKRKVIIETAKYHELICNVVDQVLYTIKTFDVDMTTLKKLRYKDHVDFCIVIGHDCFDYDGFKIAHAIIKKNIFHRIALHTPGDFKELYRYVRCIGKDFTIFNKIDLK